MWGKMQKHCVITGCTEHSASLHKLPKESEIKDEWIRFIYNTIPERFSRSLTVCSAHFTSDCFLNRAQYNEGFAQKLLLKDGAIPTLHHPTTANTATTARHADTVTRFISKHYSHDKDHEVGDLDLGQLLPDGFKNCICCVCGKHFALLDDLIEHFTIHKQAVHCHFCQATFSRVISLASHLNNAHPRQLPYCQRCCITFHNMWQMNEHMGRHLQSDITKEALLDEKKENGITENGEVQINCLKEEEEWVTIELGNVGIHYVKEKEEEPIHENKTGEVRCVKEEEEELINENKTGEVRCVKEEEEEVVIKTEEVEMSLIHLKEEEEEVVINNEVFERTCVKDEEVEVMIQNEEVELNFVKEEEGGVSIVKAEEMDANMVTKEEDNIVYTNLHDETITDSANSQICVFNNDFKSTPDQQEAFEFDLRVQGVLLDHNYCSQSLAYPIAVSNQHAYNTYGCMANNVKNTCSGNVYVSNNAIYPRGQSDQQEITEIDLRVHAILHDHNYLPTQSPVNPIVSRRTQAYNTRSSVKNTTHNVSHHSNNKAHSLNNGWISGGSLLDHNYLSDNFSENAPIQEENVEEEDDDGTLSTGQSSCSSSLDDSDYTPSKDLDSRSCSTLCSLSEFDSDDRDSEEDSERHRVRGSSMQKLARQDTNQDSTSSVRRSTDPVTKSLQICTFCGLSKDPNSENPMKQCTCILSNKCSLCEVTFATLELLLKHQADEHPKARYFCVGCLQLFLNQEAFWKHTCSKAKVLTPSVSANNASATVVNLKSSDPPFNKQVPQKCPAVFTRSSVLPKVLPVSGSQKFPMQVMTTRSLSYNQNKKVTCLLVNGGQALVTPISSASHAKMRLIPVLTRLPNKVVPKTPLHSISPQTQSTRVPLPSPASSQIYSSGSLFKSSVQSQHTCKSYAPQGLSSHQTSLKTVPMFVNRSQKMSFQKCLRQNWLSRAKFLCRQCGVMSCQPSVSVQHRYQHRGLRLHRCQCGRAFQHRLHLLRHQVQHAESTCYVCATCGRTFHGTRQLARHRLDTFFRKKARKDCTNVFPCYCGQVFGRPSALLWHMLKNVKVRKSRLKEFPSILSKPRFSQQD
ncbi:uncharacterized protein si:dkey-79d12.4 [Trichomycterus rosablanca]|uniref:uncharacterized protein si:dkey-79d12.4 n=1 Tax=Trichomycterus rosablanca TaxID=2290929 RepID=UPI002F360BFB